MGRLIKTGSASKDRTVLMRSIVLALRELAMQSQPDDMSRDLVAYIALSLLAIAQTVEESVLAWEKRGYWIKADRYRMDWNWTSRLGEALKQSLLVEDWENTSKIAGQIVEKMKAIKVPDRKKTSYPWVGAWKQLVRPK